MKRSAIAALLALAVTSTFVIAKDQPSTPKPMQGPSAATPPTPILVPDSTIEHPGDHGAVAHTNHRVQFKPDKTSGPTGLSPAQIIKAYGLLSSSGGAAIYIVDAFDYPTALSDFNAFSAQFHLPQETSKNVTAAANKVFQVLYANGSKPKGNCGWNQEAALDVEWAHAMAPNAKIVLVEAADNSFANLMAAVDVANARSDAREVSMSWGGSEFSGEQSYDVHFGGSAIVYTAASGDTGGATIYPSVSPQVISAGGTTLKVDSTGTRLSETGWSGGGGGQSAYVARPDYQNGILALTRRGTPDWSSDADPNTGVSVYDSTKCQGLSGWLVFGGTSVAAPTLAGIVNSIGSAGNSETALSLIYGNVTGGGGVINAQNFNDITAGHAGGFSATAGWDFVTGVGSTKGVGGK